MNKNKVNQQKKKVRKTQPKAPRVDKMLKSAGGQGVDGRSERQIVARVAVGQQILPSMKSTIVVEAESFEYAVQSLALGAVLTGLQRGWAPISAPTGMSGAGYNAIQALGFLNSVFINAMNGVFPTLQSAPLWLWEICAALMPTNTKFKTGTINYKWLLPSPAVNSEIPLGGGTLFFGTPTNGTANGFPILQPVAYDPAVGAVAIQSLFNLFADTGMMKRVPCPKELFLLKDTSVFATVTSELGTGAAGGLATRLEHEVRVQCPILAKFATEKQDDGKWRGYQELRKCAGTPCYIVPRVMEFASEKDFRNKASPLFKFYNFDQFFLQLTYAVAGAMEAASRDNSNSTYDIECPLTPWQVQILLRQTLLPRFSNHMAQDMQIGANSVNTLVMSTFTVSPNGVPNLNGPEMKLPLVFAESIRAVTRRTYTTQKERGVNVLPGKKADPNYVVDVLPVLCRPRDLPPLENFTYSQWDGAPAPVYKTDPSTLPISMVDLSWGSPKQYITANGQAYEDLIVAWNGWITKIGNGLTSLTNVGAEPGISLLLTTFNTSHQAFISNPTISPTVAKTGLAKVPSKPALRLGAPVPKVTKGFGAEPTPGNSQLYQNVSQIVLTSTNPFYASAQRYTQAMVQPCIITGKDMEWEGSIMVNQTFQMEPFSLPYSDAAPSSDNGVASFVTIDSWAKAAAALDVKSNLSAVSEVEVELNALAQQGRGGFFTSLVGTLGHAIGVPAISEVAEAVGALTGL